MHCTRKFMNEKKIIRGKFSLIKFYGKRKVLGGGCAQKYMNYDVA